MRGYSAIGLVRPKTPANIGSVLRAAGCYDASVVAIEGARCGVKTCAADTMKIWKRIPVIEVADVFDGHPAGSVPVAIELVDGAASLVNFVHPERAFYIFGPEDGTLGKKYLDRCPMRVMVPTNGCMNLAATVNVILYDRLAKQLRG